MVAFCVGLIIGTIAGIFSWLAAAAYLESKRMQTETSQNICELSAKRHSP
jgi:hypothetical protein